jgi:hypothetical protein
MKGLLKFDRRLMLDSSPSVRNGCSTGEPAFRGFADDSEKRASERDGRAQDQ